MRKSHWLLRNLTTVTAKRFYRSNLFAYMSEASLKKGDSRLKESTENTEINSTPLRGKPLTFDSKL